MGVARDITIRLVTNDDFIDLLVKLLGDEWSVSFTTLDVNDTDSFDFVDFGDFSKFRKVLTGREKKGLPNYVNIGLNDDESVMLTSTKLKEEYPGYRHQYELSFRPGIGKRLEKSDRHTDFSYYLNELLPKLTDVGCGICEVKCQDFDY